MKIGALFICAIALLIRAQSSSPNIPVRRCDWSTRPSEEIILNASCSRDISIEKTAEGTPLPIAAFSAMFSASVVLPIEGRPATTIRSPGCSPAVIRSRSE